MFYEFCAVPKLDTDYYGVLKLKQNCDNLQIKKAFRRLAIQYNPERRKNENICEVFSLIAEAYDVLSDPQKRSIYDHYGETGLKSGVPAPNNQVQQYVFHGDPLRTYREFFGTASPYADLMGVLTDSEVIKCLSGGHEVECKYEPVIRPLQLSLAEIFFGAVKIIKLEKLVFVDYGESCTNIREKSLTARIQPGLPTGTKILFPEEGDQEQNKKSADILFITSDRPHNNFRRKYDDLLMTIDVFLKDALTGTVVKIETLDNKILRIPITSIITPGYQKWVPGEGLPLLNQPSERGDLIINFQIEFPVYLTIASKNNIKKAFQVIEYERNVRREK